MSDPKIGQKTVVVDFDGVLCDIDYPRIGKIKTGAVEAMRMFRNLGWYIIISSCRSSSCNWDQYYKGQPFVHASERPVYREMVQWLKDNDIEHDEVDDGTKGKMSGDFYIDDKGFRFNNNWDEVMGYILDKEEKFKPLYFRDPITGTITRVGQIC